METNERIITERIFSCSAPVLLQHQSCVLLPLPRGAQGQGRGSRLGYREELLGYREYLLGYRESVLGYREATSSLVLLA